MDEETAKEVARQVRKPQGDFGIQVGNGMNQGNSYMNQYVIEILKQGTKGDVLEIGMGNGFFVKDVLAIDDSIKYKGLDYSGIMVEEAIKINATFVQSGRARFSLGDADTIPYKKNFFDTIFTVNTIYFWENPVKELTEIRRVLKPSGVFIIAIRPKAFMKKYAFTRYNFTMFSEEELIDLLTKNQFTVTSSVVRQEPEVEFVGETMKPEAVIISAKITV